MGRRRLIAGLLVLALLIAAGVGIWRTTRGDEPLAAPEGLGFYAADAEVVADGEHGSLIWERPAEGPGRAHDLLYRSTGISGDLVAVSGTAWLPEGEAPEGGWPVISWGHGTVGSADVCAPSRQQDERVLAFVEDYLDQGYVVVQTDYEGLGTPGPHPYLMGTSAGRSMVDVVAAAREIDPGVSGRWLAAGHSQGGQAALFTASVADGYSSGLDLQGIVALAPPSQMGTVMDMVTGRDLGAGANAFLVPLLASAANASGVPPEEIFSPEVMERIGDIEEKCTADLAEPDSLGGLGSSEILAEGADLDTVRGAISANDAVVVPNAVPVFLAHGTKDQLLPVILSDNLAEQYEGKGFDLTYERVEGADHLTVVEEAREDVDAWIADRLPPG